MGTESINVKIETSVKLTLFTVNSIKNDYSFARKLIMKGCGLRDKLAAFSLFILSEQVKNRALLPFTCVRCLAMGSVGFCRQTGYSSICDPDLI